MCVENTTEKEEEGKIEWTNLKEKTVCADFTPPCISFQFSVCPPDIQAFTPRPQIHVNIGPTPKKISQL